MKKISYLEIASLIIIETVTVFFGIDMTIMKEGTSMDSWLSAIISYTIGIIPIFLIIYIANYKPELPLNKKINCLFGNKLGFIINIILSVLLLVIGITLLYNINNFILSQLLYRTPFLVSSTLLMLLIIYNVNHGINVISKSSLILLCINLALFSINIISLTNHIDIANFFPLLKENSENLLSTSLKVASIKSLPLITILVIPKTRITNPQKYNKALILSYIIGAIISLSLVIVTFGVLGNNLSQTFEYPAYIVLRKIKLLGFVERIENIISLQWITGTFVYISIIIYTISKSIPTKSIKSHKIINILLGIILTILTMYSFKNNTVYNNYVDSIFPYITSGIILIYVILIIKIFLSSKHAS